jgi:hypothetical protein
MKETLNAVKSTVSTLTPAERFELLDFLELSILSSPDSIRSEWSELARTRLAEHDAGLRHAHPFDTVFSRVSAE